MISKKNLALLKKQHYAVAGKHSAVQICRWTKKSLRGEGFCYKQKFYGIKSSRCCQMSPSAVWCQNKCIHCWRAIEATQGNCMPKSIDKPDAIIKECLIGRKKLLSGFGKLSKGQDAEHFAISLIGEPTIYPHIGELIQELRQQNKTTFIVTNGLNPSMLKKIAKNKQLPTQLYLSLNTPNKWLYNKWHCSSDKQAWKKFNQSLELMKKIRSKTRTVVRMTLVKELNMQPEFIDDYAKLIKKASPLFVEVKGYMSVGYARKRLGYKTMPNWREVQDYAKTIAKATGLKILSKHEFSRVVLLGKSKKDMKIKSP